MKDEKIDLLDLYMGIVNLQRENERLKEELCRASAAQVNPNFAEGELSARLRNSENLLRRRGEMITELERKILELESPGVDIDAVHKQGD